MLVYVLIGVLVLLVLLWWLGAFRRPTPPRDEVPPAPQAEPATTPESASQLVPPPTPEPAAPVALQPDVAVEVVEVVEAAAPVVEAPPDFNDLSTEPLPLDEALPPAAAEAPATEAAVDLELDLSGGDDVGVAALSRPSIRSIWIWTWMWSRRSSPSPRCCRCGLPRLSSQSRNRPWRRQRSPPSGRRSQNPSRCRR